MRALAQQTLKSPLSISLVCLFVPVLAAVLFARLCGFPCRHLAIFLSSASAWAAPKFLPILLRYVDAVTFGRLLDIGESKLSVLIRPADCLIERAIAFSTWLASVRGSFRCFGKANTAPLGKVSMLLMRFPGCTHGWLHGLVLRPV
jgi:hypothetical protein